MLQYQLQFPKPGGYVVYTIDKTTNSVISDYIDIATADDLKSTSISLGVFKPSQYNSIEDLYTCNKVALENTNIRKLLNDIIIYDFTVIDSPRSLILRVPYLKMFVIASNGDSKDRYTTIEDKYMEFPLITPEDSEYETPDKLYMYTEILKNRVMLVTEYLKLYTAQSTNYLLMCPKCFKSSPAISIRSTPALSTMYIHSLQDSKHTCRYCNYEDSVENFQIIDYNMAKLVWYLRSKGIKINRCSAGHSWQKDIYIIISGESFKDGTYTIDSKKIAEKTNEAIRFEWLDNNRIVCRLNQSINWNAESKYNSFDEFSKVVCNQMFTVFKWIFADYQD